MEGHGIEPDGPIRVTRRDGRVHDAVVWHAVCRRRVARRTWPVRDAHTQSGEFYMTQMCFVHVSVGEDGGEQRGQDGREDWIGPWCCAVATARDAAGLLRPENPVGSYIVRQITRKWFKNMSPERTSYKTKLKHHRYADAHECALLNSHRFGRAPATCCTCA